MNDDKATMPFEETESEASLRRIAEAVRHVEEKELAYDRASLTAKAAKEALAEAREELRQIEKSETEELPLFPRPRADPSQPEGPEPKGNGSPPSPGPAHGADSDAGTFLSSLKGFPMGALIALGTEGIQSVADLRAFLADGGYLSEIEGLSPEAAVKVATALKRHEESSK